MPNNNNYNNNYNNYYNNDYNNNYNYNYYSQETLLTQGDFFRALRVLEILIHLTSSCTALYGEPEHQAQSPAVAGVFLRLR